MVYNEIMENKYLIYRILIVFVVVTFVTNMAFVALQKNVVSQEKLKAQYTVNSTISRVEIKLESYIEKVGFLKKTIEAGIDLDDAYFESVASRLYGVIRLLNDQLNLRQTELFKMYILLKKTKSYWHGYVDRT